jgi:hypothetical protein
MQFGNLRLPASAKLTESTSSGGEIPFFSTRRAPSI